MPPLHVHTQTHGFILPNYLKVGYRHHGTSSLNSLACIYQEQRHLLHIHHSIIFSKNININLVILSDMWLIFKFPQPQNVLYNGLFSSGIQSKFTPRIQLFCLLSLHQTRIVQLYCLFFSFLYLKNFIYLAMEDLSCSTWDLVPWPDQTPFVGSTES